VEYLHLFNNEGVIYYPGEPILFQSILNQYIIRRNDGVYVDGKGSGLSGFMFRSLASRENSYQNEYCDTSWLLKDDSLLRNPLNIGQYINHCMHLEKCNVSYLDYTFNNNFPNYFRTYIPNIPYAGLSAHHGEIPTIVLVCTRDISDEEVFSDYNYVAKTQISG